MKASPIPRSVVLGILVGLHVAGSACATEVITEEDITQGVIQKHELVRVADNALFLLDASSSMSSKFENTNQTCWNLVRQFLTVRNSYFPDIGHNFGIYLYTPWKVVYPFGGYDRDSVATALASLPAEATGPTDLWSGLKELDKVLKKVSGTTAVFVFTDGTHTSGNMHRPINMAAQLAENYDVCFYVISTAKEEVNKQMLEKVAALNACSRVVPFSDFMKNPTYATGALFDVKATETPVTSTEKQVTGLEVDDLTFRFNKDELREEDKRELDEVIRYLKAHPEAWVRIAGYTDNTGSDEVDLADSKRRAEALQQMLLSAGIDQSRIVTQWYGSSNPIASNETEEGRDQNRRVELAIGM